MIHLIETTTRFPDLLWRSGETLCPGLPPPRSTGTPRCSFTLWAMRDMLFPHTFIVTNGATLDDYIADISVLHTMPCCKW